ncbi:hypothetical protein [Cellulophaga sp. L1A9]|uniref:hypothetical protein n=1 Tax=Cellulophaga sp. L1A9 TaxID=2686362 RepID=UPI00131D78DE|nr:hypothetical protein [Cellulophaga sp. L1A9]
MNNKLKPFFILIALSISFITQAQTYYVDYTNGNDSNGGTSVGSAFKTIAKAKQVVATVNDGMTSDIKVYLRGGTHFVSNLLEFKSQDSGKNGFRVIYRNYPDEMPIISGGTLVTDWTNEGGDIWSSSVPNGFTFRQLYVGGNKRTRARTPNQGNYYESIGWSNRSETVNDSEIANWNNLDEVEVVEMKTFLQMRYRIGSYSVSDNTATIVPQEPDRNNMFGWNNPPSGRTSYFYENAFEFIDQDGEWYLNTDENKVYYRKTDSENMSRAQVIAPNLETIFKFSTNANSITLFGLQISHTTWLKPSSEGNMPSQGGLYKYYDDGGNAVFTYVPGAITLVTCNNIQIERCKIQHVGGNGINMFGNTRRNVILGNLFYQIADAGIVVGAQHPAGYGWNLNENTNKDELIANNYFYKMGTDYTGSGVMGTSPVRMNIIHNEFEDMKVFAVNSGFGAQQVPGNPYTSPTISYNVFEKVGYAASDVSAIHTVDNGKGGLIQGNYFSNLDRTIYPVGGTPGGTTDNLYGAGTYLDNQSFNYMISNNSYDNVPNNAVLTWGTINGTGTNSPNYLVNNYITDSYAKQIVIDNAGIETSYQDIKTLAGNFGSIGKNLKPNDRYSWWVVDHRFNEDDAAIARYNVTDPKPAPLGMEIIQTAGEVYAQNGFLHLVDNSSNALVSATREFKDLENTLLFAFKAKASQTNSSGAYMLRENEDIKVQFAFAANGQLRCWNGNTAVDLGAYLPNTEYLIEIQANPQTDTYHVDVDGVRKASHMAFTSNAGVINQVHMTIGNSATGTQKVNWFYVEENYTN